VHWHARQHFLYTTAAAARGLCDMGALARRRDELDERDRFGDLAETTTAAMRARFVDGDGVLGGSLEKLAAGTNYRDGATVEAFTWDLIPAADPTMAATLADLEVLRSPLGGFSRVEGSSDPYDTDEWVFVDLRASEAFRRLGDAAEADALFGWVTAQADVNHGLIAELFNTSEERGPLGRYAGSIPMVGYGAGLYLLTALHRDGQVERRDCGTADPDDEPDAGTGDDDPGVDEGGAGCGCHADGRGAAGGLAALALVLAWSILGRGRRRHRGR
jgi:GH15 family glucan-1,4-alpha-glucosidase